MTIHRHDAATPANDAYRMPRWPRSAYVCFVVSALANIGGTLVPMNAIPALLWEGNPWSVLLLAPTLLTLAAAVLAGRRYGGVIGRSIVGGWALGVATLAVFGFIVALAVGA